MSSPVPKLTLTYFPIGGRAEPIRLALAASGIPFTNKVLKGPEFQGVQSSFPLGQLPVLDLEFDDGTKKTLTQSTAMLRYVGRCGGLYPKDDDLAAFEIDEIISVIDDLRAPLVISVGGAVRSLLSDDTEFTPEEKLAIRRRWMEKCLPRYLGFIEKKLQDSSSGWLVGDSLSVADLLLHCELTWISGGILDGIPMGILNSYPACLVLMEKVKSHDGVKKWTDKYSKPYDSFDFN